MHARPVKYILQHPVTETGNRLPGGQERLGALFLRGRFIQQRHEIGEVKSVGQHLRFLLRTAVVRLQRTGKLTL